MIQEKRLLNGLECRVAEKADAAQGTQDAQAAICHAIGARWLLGMLCGLGLVGGHSLWQTSTEQGGKMR